MGPKQFNNTSYSNRDGKIIPARAFVEYKRKTNSGRLTTTDDPTLARDTIITATPDAPYATTQRIYLSGPNSYSERLNRSGEWVPSDDSDYWVPRGREMYHNYGNQPSYWDQFKRMIGFKQEGGIMNRINYFQQGGAAPQQDIKAQVTALVQAAMQGDQKATQQVNQIMEAAKAGDQQAMQIAQIMEQVVKELQGQATAAKWGAKLGYIKSLKYAKGGKTCPACEKKVEMKACGGKKAKKRYFGGLI